MKIYGTKIDNFDLLLSLDTFEKGDILDCFVDEFEYEVTQKKDNGLVGYLYKMESYFSGEELEIAVKHAKFLFKYRL